MKSLWVKNLWGKIGVDGMLIFVPPLLMFVPHNVMEPYGFIVVSFVPAAYFEGSIDDLDSFRGCLSMRCSF